MAARPKRTVSPATLNCTADTFTSGGSTRIPIARALVDVLHDLVGVAHFRGQERRHELDRIVGLKYAV
jgi:hypothetical protein